jgi:uncharacterized protein YijF (DUF1287 family)
MNITALKSALVASLMLGLACTVSCGRLARRDVSNSEGEASGKAPTSEGDASRGAMPERKSSPQGAPPPLNDTPLNDKGIFSDLDAKVALQCPSWLEKGPHLALHSKATGRTWLAVDGVIVCEAPPGSPAAKAAISLEGTPQDQDDDGIPDAVDILRGAKKAAKNGATYRNNYRPLAFPRGDVPREEGVCTDVVIRSLRNSGRDLQELVARDIAARPGAYPMVKTPDPNIDHRRVRTLLPYFEHALRSLPVNPRDSAAPYLPGDIVLMNTMGDLAPEHLGIVSDELGESGLPLIINNWTEGTVTRAMDLLRTVPVTHRFRAVLSLQLAPEHTGLAGILRRQEIVLPESTKQVLLVTTPLWHSTGGTLRRYEREGEAFRQVGKPVQVRVGAGGLGKGRGRDGGGLRGLPEKKEGDKKAPAGVFHLGTAFGKPRTAPYKGNNWPYRATTASDLWIDDPKSPKYNQWITLGPGETFVGSAEHLRMYTLGLVVEHNTKDRVPGAGSAIFLHPWRDPETPTIGCTALPAEELQAILGFLDEAATPLLIQLAEHVF